MLVAAPVGRDAALLARVLQRAGIAAHVCTSLRDVAARVDTSVGALLVTDHALVTDDVTELLATLAAQPPWADVPLVLLASRDFGWGPGAGPGVLARLRGHANLVVVERPARGQYLISAVQAALRGRERQYEVRDLIHEAQIAREAAEQAHRSASLASAAKDVFLANVSHELRTPAAATLLWTRLLAEGRLPAHMQARAFDAIAGSARLQSKLIEDLLDQSRIDAGALSLDTSAIDVGTVLGAATGILAPIARAKGVALVPGPPLPRCWVNGDPDRLEQVFVNILGNAVKFTQPGGSVSIRMSRHESDVRIEVVDTGAGISPELLPSVFDRFRRGGDGGAREAGLGLGLAIAKHVVDLHQGRLTASSAGEGHGATFVVDLPSCPAPAAVSRKG
ncbi:MAG: two-component hybrid sensor and regulator [Labilithrix sp.]|nr:two-component hybrid sensor and regulator [Labilithrix sp.]